MPVMKKINFLLSTAIVFVTLAHTFASSNFGGSQLDDPFATEIIVSTVQDTIPLNPRYGDFVTDDNYNPFDLKDPEVIDQNVEYDPETGQYIITEKMGDEYYRMPTYMSFEEYLDYQAKEQERKYFNQLAGISNKDDISVSGLIDPVQKFDIQSNLIDRLFGGTEVDIRPQGNIQLDFGVDYSKRENPSLTVRQQRNGGFDFDMGIQMSVEGKIGEKLNLSTNYNTQATFDVDNQMKLDYNSDQFSEDEIIKKIEAGNVSLPLRTNLIQGSESLFGLKTELQFGRLWLTALAATKQAKQEEITLEGGGQIQTFEVDADEYDENRHFFLSHYNRAVFEESLQSLPQVNALFRITKMEVWVTYDGRNNFGSTPEDGLLLRNVIAVTDLGEGVRIVNDNPQYQAPIIPRNLDISGEHPLPTNDANDLYRDILRDPDARSLERTVTRLKNQFKLEQGKDFQKVRAIKLDPNQYDFHPQLGFVSLSPYIRQDQIVGVAYEYTYNGQVYQVGEFSNDSNANGGSAVDSTSSNQDVLFVKMLKSNTPLIGFPTWDLMMKNIYAVGAFQVDRENFKLDIYYEDPGKGEKRFLPESNLSGQPLLQVFNLDRLNVQGDPCSDGIFDFVPGVTINPRNGRVMFPVLEPFGSDLSEKITDPALAAQYSYQMLYDSTLFRAREFPEFNRFTIRGTYKASSSSSSEISLNAFNLPPGSVSVFAGGEKLVEGQDYTINYQIGRVTILNDAIISSGRPIRVQYENNTFNFNQKTMVGLRGEYRFSEDVSLGATYMHLFERPFTQKVNIGEDPINNRIYGLDFSISKEAPWLTKAVDALPLIETKAPSNINFVAEGAWLKPGHSKAINENDDDEGGILMIDDFEGSATSIDLRARPNNWVLASIPQNDSRNANPMFPEGELVDDLVSGANRAQLNWYRIDQFGGAGCSDDSIQTSYCARIPLTEVFPNQQVTPGTQNIIQSFDLSYYPNQRGPYNYDIPEGTPYTAGVDVDGSLKDPSSRWAGVMQRITSNNDFEQQNIEFLEFWMLSPFLPGNGGTPISGPGDLYLELGNLSEDIIRDARHSLESGIPSETKPNRVTNNTNLARVLADLLPQNPNSFDINTNDSIANRDRALQDVGLDGFSNEAERIQFKDVLDAHRNANPPLNGSAITALEADPSNDDFVGYNDAIYNEGDLAAAAANNPLLRYSRFNGLEGNTPVRFDNRATGNNNNNNVGANQLQADNEDLNNDGQVNETEAYFQYRIPLEPTMIAGVDAGGQGVADNGFITDVRQTRYGRPWYRFKIPLEQFTRKVGAIQDFRSIQFIRIYVKGFDQPVTLRFARLELVRNQWRRYARSLNEPALGIPDESNFTKFDVDAVNIEENSARQPFAYVLPPGIQRENSIGAFPNVLQNEQSLQMNVCDLQDGDARAVFKSFNLDLRVYDRIKMFVHAESQDDNVDRGDLTMFMRVGSDFEQNYYEYEIPISMSDVNLAGNPANPAIDENYIREVWREDNEFNFALDSLVALKSRRNGQAGFPLDQIYFENDRVQGRENNIIKIKGNPNLGLVKGVMVGVRNKQDDGLTKCAEFWINELRVSGLDERGGGAALARLDVQLADFGSLNAAWNTTGIGYGGIEQKIQQRARQQTTSYDLSANLELGKLLPEQSGIKVPFYATYSRTVETPEFDPYDLDIVLKDKLNDIDDLTKRDSVEEAAKTFSEIKSINFTNVRKERTKKEGVPLPWDISNFDFTYSHTQTLEKNPIVEKDLINQYRGTVNYNYTVKPLYIKPFKNVAKGNKYLKFITDVNFNLVPNTLGFNTTMDRHLGETTYRFTDDDPLQSTFYDKRFAWDRNYTLNWDLMESLKLNFNATNTAVIDELKEYTDAGVRRSQEELRDFIYDGIRNFGRTKNYNHTFSASYKLPLDKFYFLDWISVNAQYGSSYAWSAAALDLQDLGNVVQNTQNRQLGADVNFLSLYKKSKYLEKILRGKSKSNRRSGRQIGGASRSSSGKNDDKKKKTREPSVAERILIRPLMALNKANLNYSETFSTILPGYMPNTKYFGLEDGFGAPGWEFVAGLQPNTQWFDDAAANGWISDDIFQSQELLQNYTQNFSGTLNIEPINDFRIDITANRTFTENHAEIFKDTLNDGISDIVHAAPRDYGSLSISYSALRTLFVDDSNEGLDALFQEFEDNRAIISQRLGTGQHDTDTEFGNYTAGYGRYQQDVLIPAFMAAYTGQDVNSITTSTRDLFNTLPRLNWRVSYDGLAKLDGLKETFSSISLNHSYRSDLLINSFRTDLQYNFNDPFSSSNINELNSNYYSRFEIPDLAIREEFSPLVGIEVQLKNSMSLLFDYSKARDLRMNFTDSQLDETRSTAYTFSYSYIMEDVYIGFLKGNKRPKKRGKRKPNTRGDDDDAKPEEKEQEGSDLRMQFDFSLQDNVTLVHSLDRDNIEATRGNRTINIEPSLDYAVNDQLNLRLYFKYDRTVPRISADFPQTNAAGGIQVIFTLK